MNKGYEEVQFDSELDSAVSIIGEMINSFLENNKGKPTKLLIPRDADLCAAYYMTASNFNLEPELIKGTRGLRVS